MTDGKEPKAKGFSEAELEIMLDSLLQEVKKLPEREIKYCIDRKITEVVRLGATIKRKRDNIEELKSEIKVHKKNLDRINKDVWELYKVINLSGEEDE